ncbi:MAG: VOC family protein [Pseudomonadota bacterium]
MSLALDHLVIATRTLGEGVDWCEATFGLRPEAGGWHAFMGTHNRVFAVHSAAFPRAYAELIAIDPDAAAPTRHARWFDLDDTALQRSLAADGPQLVHWVARCDDITDTNNALCAAGVECGEVQTAERMTPRGLMRWRISVRSDGRRPLAGAAPALIEWGEAHPTDSMPGSGVTLQGVRLAGWPAPLNRLLPPHIEPDTSRAAPPLRVSLRTSRGTVTLCARTLKT